jgi:hypothetical protein
MKSTRRALESFRSLLNDIIVRRSLRLKFRYISRAHDILFLANIHEPFSLYFRNVMKRVFSCYYFALCKPLTFYPSIKSTFLSWFHHIQSPLMWCVYRLLCERNYSMLRLGKTGRCILAELARILNSNHSSSKTLGIGMVIPRST